MSMIWTKLTYNLIAACCVLVGGCAVVVENPGKPTGGEPEKTNARPTSGSVETSEDAADSPSGKSDPYPNCSASVQRSEVGRSGVSGAILRLSSADDASGAQMFVFVNEQVGQANVRDVVFTGRNIPAGRYQLIISRPSAGMCSMEAEVLDSDITYQIIIEVSLNN